MGKLGILDLDLKFDLHPEKLVETMMVRAQIHMMTGGLSDHIDQIDLLLHTVTVMVTVVDRDQVDTEEETLKKDLYLL
jgi:glycerol-3-phosphate responsive antiterminator